MDLGAALWPQIFATDARGSDDRGDAGAFCIVVAHPARSLGIETLKAGTIPNKPVVRLNGDSTHLKFGRNSKEVSVPFSRVPKQLLDQCVTCWQEIGS